MAVCPPEVWCPHMLCTPTTLVPRRQHTYPIIDFLPTKHETFYCYADLSFSPLSAANFSRTVQCRSPAREAYRPVLTLSRHFSLKRFAMLRRSPGAHMVRYASLVLRADRRRSAWFQRASSAGNDGARRMGRVSLGHGNLRCPGRHMRWGGSRRIGRRQVTVRMYLPVFMRPGPPPCLPTYLPTSMDRTSKHIMQGSANGEA
ncbi:hypothetical protein F5B19DRAFT_211172 [Rostrohypoxylon terebratum]|nr:hypothetical protein F5B19DRAFT_211172 [Rostrohypoxylon terebratum]